MGDFVNSGSYVASAMDIDIKISWVKADTDFVICFFGILDLIAMQNGHLVELH